MNRVDNFFRQHFREIFDGYIVSRKPTDINVRNRIYRFQQQLFERAYQAFRRAPIVRVIFAPFFMDKSEIYPFIDLSNKIVF